MERLEKHSIGPPPSIPTGSEVLLKCYLCGVTGALEEEHVIPKVVFAPSDPTSYVKLSACPKCNREKGDCDEYISRCLQVSGFSSVSKAAIDRAFHRYKKGHRSGTRRKIVERLGKRPMMTDTGVALGEGATLKLDSRETNQYFTNITKGLLVAHTLKHRNWSEYNIKVEYHQLVQNPTILDQEWILPFLREGRFSQYWRHAFFYRGEEIDNQSIWVYVVYSSHVAIVSVSPNEN